MKESKISAGTKRVLLTVLGILLVLIILAAVIGTAYVENMLNLINKQPDDSTISQEEYQDFMNNQTEEPDPDFKGETIAPEDVEWEVNEETVPDDKHIINIMLIGQDRRPGQGRTRSDVMLLCTVNKNTKELTLTSFMRDLYVPIPGYQDNRMNACYAFAGMKLLNKCMETNFGIYVDGNLEVDFNGFIHVIDTMGGVDITLTNSEANYMIKRGYSVTAGQNHMDGKTALSYARNRAIGNADFSRTERQRKVITALVEKCRGMSLSQLKGLMETVLPMITTDLTNKEILDYMMQILPMLKDLKVNTQRIPADGTFKYASIRGMSVLVPDLEANRQILKGIMAE